MIINIVLYKVFWFYKCILYFYLVFKVKNMLINVSSYINYLVFLYFINLKNNIEFINIYFLFFG